MYEEFKGTTIEWAQNRIIEILEWQDTVQPRYNFQEYEQFIPLIYPNIKPIYSISNYGRIININTGNILSQITRNIFPSWYLYVGLQGIDNSRPIIAVHNIVAYNFIPKTKEDIELGRDCINHINCFKSDPRVCNLQWVTKEENNRYAQIMHEHDNPVIHPFIFKKTKKNWGNQYSTHGNKSDEMVRKICECFSNGMDVKEAILYIGLEYNKWNRRWANYIKNRERRTDISKDYIF